MPDRAYQRRIEQACHLAIDYAERSRLKQEADSEVRPLVGAVILDREGNVLAGASRDGENKKHAEIRAIEALKIRSTAVQRSAHTLITTLEPCSYRSKHDHSISCVKEIIRLGIRKVFIGTTDPAYGVRGGGINLLNMREIPHEMFEGKLKRQIRRVNKEYLRLHFTSHQTGRPHDTSPLKYYDHEFDLNFAPLEVRQRIMLKGVDETMLRYYHSWKRIPEISNIADLPSEVIGILNEFPCYVRAESSIVRRFPHRTRQLDLEIGRKESFDSRLYSQIGDTYELMARYLAISPSSPGRERSEMSYNLATWWCRRTRRRTYLIEE